MAKIVLISDTHNKHDKITVPKCDILIHAGDWSNEGSWSDTRSFAEWLELQRATDIILIPGNHERYFQTCYPKSKNWIFDYCPRAIVLVDEALELKGINFYGSPWTPKFGHNWAYNASRTIHDSTYETEPFIGDIWAKIPVETEFLITHGMPYGILDTEMDFKLCKFTNVGDKELLNRIRDLPNLKHVVGGHLHSGGGKSYKMNLGPFRQGPYVHNAAICDNNYQVRNQKPLIIYEI